MLKFTLLQMENCFLLDAAWPDAIRQIDDEQIADRCVHVHTWQGVGIYQRGRDAQQLLQQSRRGGGGCPRHSGKCHWRHRRPQQRLDTTRRVTTWRTMPRLNTNTSGELTSRFWKTPSCLFPNTPANTVKSSLLSCTQTQNNITYGWIRFDPVDYFRAIHAGNPLTSVAETCNEEWLNTSTEAVLTLQLNSVFSPILYVTPFFFSCSVSSKIAIFSKFNPGLFHMWI